MPKIPWGRGCSFPQFLCHMSTPSPFLSPYVSTQKKILVSNVYTPHIFCMQCSNLFQISSVPPFHVSSQILWDIIVPSPHKKMPKVHPPIFGSFHLHPLPPFWGLPCPFPKFFPSWSLPPIFLVSEVSIPLFLAYPPLWGVFGTHPKCNACIDCVITIMFLRPFD